MWPMLAKQWSRSQCFLWEASRMVVESKGLEPSIPVFELSFTNHVFLGKALYLLIFYSLWFL